MCKLSVTPNCASPSDKQNFYFYFDFCFSFNATEKLCDILGLSIHFIILKSVLLGESASPFLCLNMTVRSSALKFLRLVARA